MNDSSPVSCSGELCTLQSLVPVSNPAVIIIMIIIIVLIVIIIIIIIIIVIIIIVTLAMSKLV